MNIAAKITSALKTPVARPQAPVAAKPAPVARPQAPVAAKPAPVAPKPPVAPKAPVAPKPPADTPALNQGADRLRLIIL